MKENIPSFAVVGWTYGEKFAATTCTRPKNKESLRTLLQQLQR